jgi:DNA-directed RNA polymerase subunit RPC12/RpoP
MHRNYTLELIYPSRIRVNGYLGDKMGRKKIWGDTIGFRLTLEEDAAFRAAAEQEGITPGMLAKRCAMEHKPRSEGVKVWCSRCRHEFEIGKTTDIHTVRCPECGSDYVHYVPTLPTEPLTFPDIGRLKAQFEGLKESDRSGMFVDTYTNAIHALGECLAAGVFEDRYWCPGCNGYYWDAEKQRYFLDDETGAACPLPERKADGIPIEEAAT